MRDMKQSIILNNKEYPYTVTFKKMRSIIVKVRAGQLIVSAPYYTSIETIDSLIQKNKEKLIKSMESYKPYLSVEDHYVYIFGKKYELVIRDLGKKICRIHDDKLYVYSRNVEGAFEQYAKELLYQYLNEKIEASLPLFSKNHVKIEIKKYKGRWGSCFYKMNKVSFNLSLIHLKKELIDYVIMHELTHFIEANHSKRFYHELAMRMPDYLIRQNALKETHV